MASIINGTEIAAQIREEVRQETAKLAVAGITPGLATVLVGNDPASHAYVRSKRKACAEAGIASIHNELSADASQESVIALLRELAARPDVHGILVQLPLPKHLNEAAVLAEVPVHKDVDGFHPANLGLLGVKGKHAAICAVHAAGLHRAAHPNWACHCR